MSIKLTDLAEDSLREIHCRFSKDRALQIVNKILDRVDTLSKFDINVNHGISAKRRPTR